MAITSTEPNQNHNSHGSGPDDFDNSGSHRYIGIGIVIALVLLVLILWLAFAPWPRSKMSRLWHKRKQTSDLEALSAAPEKNAELRVSADMTDKIIMPKYPDRATTKEARKDSISRKTLER